MSKRNLMYSSSMPALARAEKVNRIVSANEKINAIMREKGKVTLTTNGGIVVPT